MKLFLLQVMHASTSDMICMYREGIKFWGLYDTNLAHLVIRYQTMGESLISQSISFNNCCETYGVRLNPVKDVLSGTLWIKQSTFYKPKKLEDDLAFYSACDVDPLLDLYEIQKSLIEPDFLPILDNLIEFELVRCIDDELKVTKSKHKSRMNSHDLFFYNLSPQTRKGHIYEALTRVDGYKKVYFCKPYHTAHAIFSSRSHAIMAFKILTKQMPEGLGEDTKIALVSDIKAKEIEEGDREYSKYMDSLKEESYIVDTKLCREIVETLEQTACPIACDFILRGTQVSLEMFAGKYPTLKFHLTPELVSKGKLGQLLSSKRVPKIVSRIDASNVYAALKMCNQANFRPKNFFDLASAFKMFHYWWYGQSMYKMAAPSIKDLLASFGLPTLNKLSNYVMLYHHFQEEIPLEFLELLSEKFQTDLDMGGQISLTEAKESRRLLRMKLENSSIHVTCERGNESNLKRAIVQFLEENDIHFKRIIVAGKHAIVELQHTNDTMRTVTKMQLVQVGPVVLNGQLIDLHAVIDKKKLPLADTEALDKLNSTFVQGLEKRGFYDIPNKPQQVPKHSGRTFSSLDVDEFKTLFR